MHRRHLKLNSRADQSANRSCCNKTRLLDGMTIVTPTFVGSATTYNKSSPDERQARCRCETREFDRWEAGLMGVCTANGLASTERHMVQRVNLDQSAQGLPRDARKAAGSPAAPLPQTALPQLPAAAPAPVRTDQDAPDTN